MSLSPERQRQLEELRQKLEQEEREEAERRAATQVSDEILSFEAPVRPEPLKKQIEGMNFLAGLLRAGEPGGGILLEQGCGKSYVALALTGAMALRGTARWALIVCPNTVRSEWAHPSIGQIAKHSTLEADVIVLEGPKSKRLQELRRQLMRSHRAGRFCWAVTNVDQFSSRVFQKAQGRSVPHEEFQAWLTFLEEAPPAVLIADESSLFKNPNSTRSRAVRLMAQKFRVRFILSGTPITQSPLDAWAQFEIIKPGALGHYTYLAFERHYGVAAIRRLGRGAGARQFVEIVDYRNLDELHDRIAALSFRATLKECQDLPPVVERRIGVTVSPEQHRALRELKSDMIAELKTGALVDGRNILTRYQRMAQILGGFVGTMAEDGNPKGELHAFDPNPKLAALLEYLDLAFSNPTHKAVVFCLFRAEIRAVVEAAKKRGWHPVELHGGIDTDDRALGRAAFDTDPDCRLYVAQYQTGAYGLNLTSANHLIFYSLTFSLELYLQAKRRVHRTGQTRQVNEVYLIAESATRKGPGQTLDWLIIDALQKKQGFADLVTGDLEKERERLDGLP